MVAFAALVNDGSSDGNVFTATSDDGDSWTFGVNLPGLISPGGAQRSWIRGNGPGTAWLVASSQTYTSPDALAWTEVPDGSPHYGDLWDTGLQWCEYSGGLNGWLASPPFEDSVYDIGGFVPSFWTGNSLQTGVTPDGYAYTYDGTITVAVGGDEGTGGGALYAVGNPLALGVDDLTQGNVPLGWGDATGLVQTAAGWLAVSSVVGSIFSPDAVNWTLTSDDPAGALGVRYIGSRYVTWQGDAIIWSADGSTWNSATIPDSVTGISDVAYARGAWVAAFNGTDGCFIRSANLDDWAVISGPPGFATRAYSVDGTTSGIPPTRQYPRADALALGAARQAQAGSNAPSSVQNSARQGYANTFS